MMSQSKQGPQKGSLQQIIGTHPVVAQVSGMMPMISQVANNVAVFQMLNNSWDVEEMIRNFKANQHMLYQIRGELVMARDGTGLVHDQIDILTQRVNSMEVALSTIDKAIFLLQRQLGFTETLRIPDPEPIEERLDEHGLD